GGTDRRRYAQGAARRDGLMLALSARETRENAMPTRDRVQAFVAMVEAGEYVEAIRQFYTDDASMQENLGTTRTGRDALAAHEEATLKSVRSITTRPGSTYAIDGDRVIVHWVFD